jgi:hypothetical protein
MRAIMIGLLIASCASPVAAAEQAYVHSSRGLRVRVAPSARAALQCVIDFVEAHGVRIVSLRGRGPGTVRGSLHPSGRALDINQLRRDVTRPRVPRKVSIAAARHCDVRSGAEWRNADNGHWNLILHARPKSLPRREATAF